MTIPTAKSVKISPESSIGRSQSVSHIPSENSTTMSQSRGVIRTESIANFFGFPFGLQAIARPSRGLTCAFVTGDGRAGLALRRQTSSGEPPLGYPESAGMIMSSSRRGPHGSMPQTDPDPGVRGRIKRGGARHRAVKNRHRMPYQRTTGRHPLRSRMGRKPLLALFRFRRQRRIGVTPTPSRLNSSDQTQGSDQGRSAEHGPSGLRLEPPVARRGRSSCVPSAG